MYKSLVYFLDSATTFSNSIMSKKNNRSGARTTLTGSWCFSVITALSSFGQTSAHMNPKRRDSLSVALSSWCLPQRLQQPPASVATSDASHLANKSIMRKATASDLSTSPVIPGIPMRGQRRVRASWVMEIRSNWSSANYLGLAFSSNDCCCWHGWNWQKIRIQ